MINFNDNKVIPCRLKQARISRGFSMIELADLVGVSKQAISQYETDKSEPSKKILNDLSGILKYPVSFFYKNMPISEVANSAIFFRSGKTTKVKNLSAAKAKMDIFIEITNYLSNYVDFPNPKLPKINYPDCGVGLLSNDEIEEFALILRNYWGLGIGPINNLTNTIQKNGVMVSKMLLRLSKLEAFSVWNGNKPFIFLSSDKESNARVRFDIAHELGHLLMHADFYNEEDINEKEIYEKMENEANRFAGAFLMPRETFSKDVFSTSIDHFIQLKSKWKTSISSMIYRCETLGVLSQNQIKYLKDQMTTRVYWRKEPLDSTMPVEKPFAHKQAVEILLENQIITPNQIVDDIGCNADEIEEYCFLEKGTLNFETSSNIIQLKRFN